jgi:phosphomannomutase/phosphoglucomutase
VALDEEKGKKQMAIDRMLEDFRKGNKILDRRSDDGKRLGAEDIWRVVPELFRSAIASRLLDTLDYVVLGGDGRIDTPQIIDELTGIITDMGINVVSVGYNMTTPAVEYLANLYGAKAAIAVTASHLPFMQNGLKISFLNHLYGSVPDDSMRVKRGKAEVVHLEDDADRAYHSLLGETIDSCRGVSICVDYMHGTTSKVFGRVIEEKGGKVFGERHNIVNGFFPGLVRNAPEPTDYGNLDSISGLISETGAEMGVVFDGDGDRLIVLNERGQIIDPVILGLVIASGDFSRYGPGRFVAERKLLCVKAALERIGLEPVFSQTGRANMKRAISESHAYGGYELSGHIFDRDGYDDAMRNMLRVIRLCSSRKESISGLADEMADALGFYSPELRFSYDAEEAKKMVEFLQAGEGKPDDVVISVTEADANLYLRRSANESKVTAMAYGRSRAGVERLMERCEALPEGFRKKLLNEYERSIKIREKMFYRPKGAEW